MVDLASYIAIEVDLPPDVAKASLAAPARFFSGISL